MKEDKNQQMKSNKTNENPSEELLNKPYLCNKDIQNLFGCASSKAYKIIKEINKKASHSSPMSGKCFTKDLLNVYPQFDF